jgi:AcrR family transcriptional regulator/DNA-binding MarR family transcriptional regulator
VPAAEVSNMTHKQEKAHLLDAVEAQFLPLPDIQRTRIMAALVEVVRERGAAQTTVTDIVERSGVSRRTFYELFEDREACFLAALHDGVERAGRRVRAVLPSASSWRERVRVGLQALLELCDEEPALAGLCVVDTLAAGPDVLRVRVEVLQSVVDFVDRGRTESSFRMASSKMVAEGVVGGVLTILHRRLLEHDRRSATALLNPLMAMIVLPYLGAVAAEEEASRKAPGSRRRPAPAPSNPLEGLGMRLTYRTVRVLCALAEAPDANNREVADAAGIVDQGQISKLLSRLEHIGLAQNTGGGIRRGEPNAWRLTPKGHELQHALIQQAAPA